MFKINQPFVGFQEVHGVSYNRGDILFFGREVAKTATRIVVTPMSLYGNRILNFRLSKDLPMLRCDDCRQEEWSKVPKTIRCGCGRLSDYTICTNCA